MSKDKGTGDIHLMVENNTIRGSKPKYEPDPRGLGFVLMEAMKRHKDKVAQHIITTGEEDTYQDLLQRCIRTALKIRSLGLTKNDTICLCSNNHKNTCVPYIAAILLGIKTACLDQTLTVMDTEHLLNLVKPNMVFANNKGIELIQNALRKNELKPDIVAFEENDKFTSFDSFLASSPDEEQFKAVIPESLSETIAIFFSSGTTGLPKAIRQSHYSFMVNSVKQLPITGTRCYYDLSSQSTQGDTSDKPVILCYSAFYWISAALLLLTSIHSGAARLIGVYSHYKETWDLIDKYKVTMAFLAPGQCMELSKNPKPKEELDTSSLRTIFTVGGIIPSSVLPDLRKMFPNALVCLGYGLTETTGICCTFLYDIPSHRDWVIRKPTSCGVPLEGLLVKIVDTETEETLGPHQQGELRVKGTELCTGYYNADNETPFDSEGWIKTGDLMYYDEEFCFYFVDRLKEMLKYKSYQIAPAMIEQVILQHPTVQRVVVFGVPHPEDGDHPAAVVILAENHKGVTAEDIKKFVDEKVEDRQKLRGGVKIVKEFPMTPSGKVKRKELRQMFLENKI